MGQIASSHRQENAIPEQEERMNAKSSRPSSSGTSAPKSGYFQHWYGVRLQEAPLHYTQCGLDNVYLLNGFGAALESSERYVMVVDEDCLHKAIGRHLVTTRKTLSSKEIRFLRKTLGLSQPELGRLIGQGSQPIGRWETGRSHISGCAERLLRLVFLDSFKQHGDIQPLTLLKKLDELNTLPENMIEFLYIGGRWSKRVA